MNSIPDPWSFSPAPRGGLFFRRAARIPIASTPPNGIQPDSPHLLCLHPPVPRHGMYAFSLQRSSRRSSIGSPVGPARPGRSPFEPLPPRIPTSQGALEATVSVYAHYIWHFGGALRRVQPAHGGLRLCQCERRAHRPPRRCACGRDVRLRPGQPPDPRQRLDPFRRELRGTESDRLAAMMLEYLLLSGSHFRSPDMRYFGLARRLRRRRGRRSGCWGEHRAQAASRQPGGHPAPHNPQPGLAGGEWEKHESDRRSAEERCPLAGSPPLRHVRQAECEPNRRAARLDIFLFTPIISD